MQNFFAENKITCITDYNETWVNLVKKIKDSDFNKVPKMDKKLTQYFHLTVKIYLPKNILIVCDTPYKLIEFVGTTPFMIKLPQNDRNETIRITNPRIRKRGTPMHYHLHNFLMWRIPSDFYKLKTPSLELVGHHVKKK